MPCNVVKKNFHYKLSIVLLKLQSNESSSQKKKKEEEEEVEEEEEEEVFKHFRTNEFMV